MLTSLQYAHSDAAVYWILHRITQKKTLYTYNANVAVPLTHILLTWRIRWAPNNASRWQVGFNAPFKGLDNKIFDYREGHKEFHCNDCLRTVLYTRVETSSLGCTKEESQ